MPRRVAPRPVLRRLADAARVARRGLPAPPPAAAPPPPALPLLDRTLHSQLALPGPLARGIAARLTAADREAVRRFLQEGGLPAYGPDTADLPAVAVPLALHLGLPGVGERLGLTAEEPPEDVHAMSRGPLATGGAVYDADLFDLLLREARLPLEEGERVLDFGCSSGRLVRVLKDAVPGVDLWGCDPNEAAIAWAREHVGGVTFHTSPTDPPLGFLDDASVDVVFAVSIWSHFAREPALAWLEEMRRILRPGGRLVLTTHGWQSVAYYGGLPDHELEDQRPIAHELYRSGHAFHPIFGDEGDWGVQHPGWGQAFFSADWLAAHATPQWAIRLFRPGVVHWNQDAYVLVRSPS